MMVERVDGDGVVRIQSCNLHVGDGVWTYAAENAAGIEYNWLRASQENPRLFNGTIYLMESFELVGESFQASFLKSDFKSYLYWRHNGFPQAGVWDAFGSGIICSCEGHVILGRQASGHVNAGLAYMPGGFIDSRDVRARGRVDIKANILREMLEETGIDLGQAVLEPGYYLTFLNSQVSIGMAFRSRLSSFELRDKVRSHIASEETPELVDVVVATPGLDLETLAIAPFAVPLLKAVFCAQQRKS